MKMCLCDVNKIKYLLEIINFYKDFFEISKGRYALSEKDLTIDAKYQTFINQLERDVFEE